MDLYIIPKQKSGVKQLYNKKIKFLVALELVIGGQKVDIVIAQSKNRFKRKRGDKNGIRL